MRSLVNKENEEEGIKELEDQIAILEKELAEVEKAINAFEAQIRAALYEEISEINRLTALYKQLKQAKKDKRLLQKQKGKNYKPLQDIVVSKKADPTQKLDLQEANNLKKLYKEAVMQVHPDKFEESDADVKERAHDLTAELIGVYKSGDIERLIALHDHIMSGNALSHVPFEAASVVDHQALGVYLRTQRDALSIALEKLKSSYIYDVLQSYAQPLQFIEELRAQFVHRVQQLQKRTRKA